MMRLRDDPCDIAVIVFCFNISLPNYFYKIRHTYTNTPTAMEHEMNIYSTFLSMCVYMCVQFD